MGNERVGTFIKYADKEFRGEREAWLRHAVAITMDYESRGIPLTLRGLYYKYVSRNIFANKPQNYGRLGDVVSDGRMAGLISWTSIVDYERDLMGTTCWESPHHALAERRQQYKLDLWANQPMRVEVWFEKKGMSGIVGQACADLRVDYFGCRGYNSQTEQWRAGQRFASYYQHGQRPVVLHLGDHDPSGIDMTRDNRDRLSQFCGVPVFVKRLALNMDQVEANHLPPNPAKLSDSRAADYVAQFGDESWEIDALAPEYIMELIASAVAEFRDPKLWEQALEREAHDKERIDEILQGMEE